LAILVGVGIGAAALGAASEYPTTIRALSWGALMTSAAGVCFAGALAVGSSSSPSALLKLAAPARPLRGGRLALAVVGMLTLSHGISLILIATGARESSVLARVDGLLARASGTESVEAVLALALAPALAEEIFFRGALLSLLSQRLGAGWGLLLSSLLFGLLHLDPAQGGAAAVLGLYLGALTLRTGSIHAAILCHGLNNLMAILAALWAP
jgi:membrane protease YdiL (CAAX protease family)